MNDLYEIAWKILDVRIGDKTSWGRNDLKSLMSLCFQQAADEIRHSNSVHREVSHGPDATGGNAHQDPQTPGAESATTTGTAGETHGE